MANLKDYFKPKKRNVSLPIKILTILLVILIAAFIYFTFSDTRDKSEPAASVSDDNVEIQEFSVEDITRIFYYCLFLISIWFYNKNV